MVMPQMGESIAEATILKWLKGVGDQVEKDEVILEISTDKVDSEIPAPASGTITELLFNEGDVVPVKVKIATIDSAAEAAATSKPTAPAPTATTSSPAMSSSGGLSDGAASVGHTAEITETNRATSFENGVNGSSNGDSSSGDRFYSPLVKSLAERHGVSLGELDTVDGSGHGGRVNKDDFYRFLESRSESTPQTTNPPAGSPTTSTCPASTKVAAPSSSPSKPSSSTKSPGSGMPSLEWTPEGTKIVPMDNMRMAIAEHMVRSKHTSPHVYSVQEVDVTNIAKWRTSNQSEFVKREGFKLSFTPFFLEAAVRAIVEFPMVNSSLDGNKVILKRHINLGCAVALGTTGLIVPIIKKAEEKNFVGITRSLNDLALRARSKKLMPDDVQGGTFTVTNPGTFGTVIGYPIINQPQVAILSLGAITKRPVVIDDAIAIRSMVYLTLSYDHRIVDGALGGSFLAFIKQYLEGWDLKRPLY